MRPVQLTLDDALVDAVDRAARSLGTTRVAFIREAIQAALTRLHERELELRHRAGYERKPVEPGEFSDWESEKGYLTERAEFSDCNEGGAAIIGTRLEKS